MSKSYDKSNCETGGNVRSLDSFREQRQGHRAPGVPVNVEDFQPLEPKKKPNYKLRRGVALASLALSGAMMYGLGKNVLSASDEQQNTPVICTGNQTVVVEPFGQKDGSFSEIADNHIQYDSRLISAEMVAAVIEQDIEQKYGNTLAPVGETITIPLACKPSN